MNRRTTILSVVLMLAAFIGQAGFAGEALHEPTPVPVDMRLQGASVAPLRSTPQREPGSDELHTRVFYLQAMEPREAVALLRSKLQVPRIASFADRDLVVVAGTAGSIDAAEALLRERDALARSASPHQPLTLETPEGLTTVSTVFRVAEDRSQQAALLLRSIYQIRRISEFPQDDSMSVHETEPVLEAVEAMLRELGLLAAPIEEIRNR